MPSFEEPIESYRPPRSYWRQIDALDRQIHLISEPSVERLKIGMFTLKARQVVWTLPEDSARRRWISFRFLHNGISVLDVYDLVTVDPAAEGLSTPGCEAKTGTFGKYYAYISGLALGIRPLFEDTSFATDVFNPHSPKSDRASRLLDQRLGVETPAKEAFDTLLTELQRCVSGEYQLLLPEPSEG